MVFSWNNTTIFLFPLFLIFVSSSSLKIESKSFTVSSSSHDVSTGNINTNESFLPLESSPANIPGLPNKPPSPEAGITLVPTWIKRQRATKVLEEPLESQLVQFQERGDKHVEPRGRENDREKFIENLLSLSLPSRLSPGNMTDSLPQQSLSSLDPITARKIPVVPVAGVQRHDNLIPTGIVQRRRFKTKEPSRRQDISLIPIVTEEAAGVPTPPLSPIEASLGGFTGLQGLPPLTFVQFVKILVATTPFLIPIIFVPLLLFSIGILMIPVTRSNIFVDVGDLRRSSNALEKQSLLSSYLVSPLKKFTGNVVMPRAYQLANEVIDHEQCIERISCEISERYLNHMEWNGSWRSVANKSWISRILAYVGKDRPTLSRIAKSLNGIVEEDENGDKVSETNTTGGNGKATSVQKEDKDITGISEISGSREGKNTNSSGSSEGEHERSFINNSACRKYVCQPTTFLRRMFAKK